MSNFPYDTSNIFSDFFFTWHFKNLQYFRKTPPSSSNLFKVPESESLKSSLRVLKNHWRNELKGKSPNFLIAITKTVMKDLILSTLLIVFSNWLNLSQGILVNYIIQTLQETPEDSNLILLYTLLFSIFTVFSACLKHNGSLRALMLTGKVKNLVALTISKKCLNISSTVISEESTKGKIVNVVSTDLEILELTVYVIYFLGSPLVVIAGLVIIVTMFGPAGLVGIAISVLHTPLVLSLGRITMKIRLRASKIGDTRIKMIQNLIEGIKIMKLYAWEIPFLTIISKIRESESKVLRGAAKIYALLSALNLAGIGLVIFASLATQVALGNELKPGAVFMAITIFNIAHQNIVYVSTTGVNTLFSFVAAMKRVTQVLLLRPHKSIDVKSSELYSLELKDVTFSWREHEKKSDVNTSTMGLMRSKTLIRECLREITAKVPKKSLVLVVGPVGCGKSSLLMGLLGELNLTEGDLQISGSISYASEEPWIIAGSIKDNILMGRTFDPDLYDTTIHACDLHKDLETFKNRDETLLEDRGFTLSGGQRARLCLARVVYSNSDIVLLDDPLSAVDPEVSNHLFHECIKGALSEKTVVLATHQVHFIPEADFIMVLEGGDLIFYGKYEELKNRDDIKEILGDFAFRDKEVKQNKKKNEKVTQEIGTKLEANEEEVTEGGVSGKNYLKYTLFGFKSVLMIFFVFCLTCLSQACYVITIYWASYWSKQTDQENLKYIYYYLIILCICYLACMLRTFPLLQKYVNSNLLLHNTALKSLALSPSTFFDKNPTGRLINRFSKDMGVVDGPLQHYLYDTLSVFLLIFGNIVTMMVIIPINVAIFPLIVILWYFLFKTAAPLIVKLRKIELIARGPLLSSITSAVNGLPTLRCLKLEVLFWENFKMHAENHQRAYLTFHVFLRFIQFYSDLIGSSILILNLIFIVSISGFTTPALAAFSLSSSIALLTSSGLFSKNVMELGGNMASAQRLIEFCDLLPESTVIEDQKTVIAKGHLVFQNVFMRYRPHLDFALAGLSCEIQAGQKIGIIGRTGSGKSSILQVLFRLVNPEAGTIFIDGTDYMTMNLYSLRQQMSVIPQSTVLFVASIRENLDPLQEHSDQAILAVLDEVKLKDIVMEYDQGLYAEIKSDGVSLSAGQKQLLCLARAILRNNKIVVMDEATANVDNETDRFIQETVKAKFKTCSLLIIAHRLRTIIDSHKIMVVNAGKCVEFGTPAELLVKEDSLFKNILIHTGPEESKYLENFIMQNK